MTFSTMALNAHAKYHYAECYYGECYYAECYYAECHNWVQYAEFHYTECRGTITDELKVEWLLTDVI
jgi:hypothetical protein